MPVFDQETGMSIKKQLKNIPVFYQANAVIKARSQERKAAGELAYYRRKAFEAGIKLPEGDALVRVLKKRLAKRGIHPISKGKGDLHIFLAAKPLS